jgi:non-heme chloroperoxidase
VSRGRASGAAGAGEVARYIGAHGTARLRSCVFIESLAPSFAMSADNPTGVDEAGVADVQRRPSSTTALRG